MRTAARIALIGLAIRVPQAPLLRGVPVTVAPASATHLRHRRRAVVTASVREATEPMGAHAEVDRGSGARRFDPKMVPGVGGFSGAFFANGLIRRQRQQGGGS